MVNEQTSSLPEGFEMQSQPSTLPQGFVLQGTSAPQDSQPQSPEASLPSGFVLQGTENGTSPTTSTTEERPGWSFANKVHDIWHSDESTPGKVWDTVNTPLVDLKREGAHGVEAGVEDFASGLTSPLSAGLALVSAGAGPILERLGITLGGEAAGALIKEGSAAAKLGVTTEQVEKYMGAAKTVSKLAAAGFTFAQLKGITDESPEFIQAIKNGDTDKALELGTGILLQGATAAIGAKHAASGLFEHDSAEVTPSDRLLGTFTKNRKADSDVALRFNTDLLKTIPNPVDREALHFYGEAEGDLGKLAEWQKQVEESKDISPDLQRQVVRDLKKAQNLDPKTIQQLDKLHNMYETVHGRASAVNPDGTPSDTHIMESSSYRNNYLARAPWEHEPDEQERVYTAQELLGDASQDHTQKRVFDTTVDGILKGYKPRKTGGRYMLDSADLAADYYRAMGLEMAKKQFVEQARRGYGSDNRPLIAPGGAISKFDAKVRNEDGVLEPSGKQTTLLDSNAVPNHALNKDEVKVLKKRDQLQAMIDRSHIIDSGPKEETAQSAKTPRANQEKTLEENAPTFYLKSEKLINEKMKGPMPAEQTRKMLLSNGVKEDELKWSGLDDALQGDKKVTPDELRQAIAEKGVQLQEKTLGDRTPDQELRKSLVDRVAGINQRVNMLPDDDDFEADRLLDERHQLQMQLDDLDEEEMYGRGTDTKYSGYTLPGGENYREMLMTLPDRTPAKETFEQWQKRVSEESGIPVEDTPDERRIYETDSWVHQQNAIREGGGGNFQSGHWEDPNVLAHVRFNDRTGPNGEKLLHLEELQSDWHQKGRDQGYQVTPEEKKAARDRQVELRRKTIDTFKSVGNLGYDYTVQARNAVLEDPNWAKNYDVERSLSPEQIKDINDWADAKRAQDRAFMDGHVPDAPFKKTWHELALRRMLRYAAENGYDGVSWTPGAEQNERYSLSKQVDDLRYIPETHALVGFKDNVPVVNHTVAPNDLPSYVGKEVAQRLLASDLVKNPHSGVSSHMLQGKDLEVGGSGMKGFYDKIIPDYLNKYGKKWGAKVGETEIPTNRIKGSDDFWGEIGRSRRLYGKGKDIYAVFGPDGEFQFTSELPKPDAQYDSEGTTYVKVVDKDGNLLKDADIPKGAFDGKKVQYLPVTDEMKDSVLHEGQPLFNKTGKSGDNVEAPVGELRKNGRGENTLWVNKDAADVLRKQFGGADDIQLNGLQLNGQEVKDLVSDLDEAKAKEPQNTTIEELQKWLGKANEANDGKGVVIGGRAGSGVAKAVKVLREERNHALQQELTKVDEDGKPVHLSDKLLRSVHKELPLEAHSYLDHNEYPADRNTRVIETAAKLMSGHGDEMGISPEAAEQFLTKYYDALEQEHGAQAFDKMDHVVGIAKRLRDERIANGQEAGVSDAGTDAGAVQREEEAGSNRGNPSQEKQGKDDYYPGRYHYNTDDYKVIQSRHTRTSVWGGSDGTMLRSFYAFHPELFNRAELVLNPKKSWLQTNPFTSKILGLSTQAKQSLLSLSGFHWVQIGLRGIESGVNPLKPLLEWKDGVGGWDLDNPLNPDRERQLRLIESNGIMPGITQGANSFSEGLKGHGIVSKVPGVGKVIDSVNNALFGPNGYIDRMKLSAALDFERRLRPMIKDDAQRYKAAGQLANQRFGGLNYLAMGRSQTARDIMRLTLLAPDWLESNMRDAVSTLGPYGKLSRFDFARIALYNFAAAQTLNMLTTGKMQLDQPFSVVSKDGKKTYSVRTLPEDIYHALTQPMDYMTNRLNPLLARTGVEAITGRDRQGHLRDTGQQIQDLLENITPIPLHGVTNALTGNFRPGESAGDYVRSAAGLTTKANNSPAEQMAFKMASQNSSTRLLPSEQAAHMHRLIEYEDRLRGGDPNIAQDIQRDLQEGRLAPDDVRQITKASTSTRLQAVVTRLPMEQAIDVWKLATNAEREELSPVMVKKMQSFRKTEALKLTPDERAHMDVKIAGILDSMFNHAGVK